jgi:hypothetical protein
MKIELFKVFIVVTNLQHFFFGCLDIRLTHMVVEIRGKFKKNIYPKIEDGSQPKLK